MKNLKLLLILSPIFVNTSNDAVDISQRLLPTSAQIKFQEMIKRLTQEELKRMQNPTQYQLDSFLFSKIDYLNPNLIKELLEKGANPNTGFEGKTVLLRAITASKDPNIIKTLIEAGANPNTPDNSFMKYSPLHYAIKINSPDILKILLDAGANPEAQDKYLNTALHTAISENKPELAQMLLNAGANPNAKGDRGNTPLHIAISENKPELVQMLLNAGANPNAKGDRGNTPLHIAAERNNLYIINMLLNARADKTILNDPTVYDILLDRDWGRTPLEIAKSQKNPNPEIIKALEEPSWFSWFYN